MKFTSEVFTGVLNREEIERRSAHQALGNKTPDMAYQSASGGGAKEELPVELSFSETAFKKDSLEKTVEIEFKNRSSANQVC